MNKIIQKVKRKMKDKRNYLKERGITLIALVITIVVLLILAGVTINAVFSDSGIIKKAQEAQNKMDQAAQNDLDAINNLNEWIDNSVNGTTGKNTPIIKTMTIKLITGTQGTYSFEEGMTWGEWIVSKYNTDGFKIINNCICSSGGVGSMISPSTVINEGEYFFRELFQVQ